MTKTKLDKVIEMFRRRRNTEMRTEAVEWPRSIGMNSIEMLMKGRSHFFKKEIKIETEIKIEKQIKEGRERERERERERK